MQRTKIVLSLLFMAVISGSSCAQKSDSKEKAKAKETQIKPGMEIATFGSGCFWCTEAIFLNIDGVVKVESGYSGGKEKNPTYREVCSGLTGHAEVI